MKKHLRGKRYIRSRASVVIGRNKKTARKAEDFAHQLQQAIHALSLIDWGLTLGEFAKAVRRILESINDRLIIRMITGGTIKLGDVVSIADDGKVYASTPEKRLVFAAPIDLKEDDLIEFNPVNGKVFAVHRENAVIYEITTNSPE